MTYNGLCQTKLEKEYTIWLYFCFLPSQAYWEEDNIHSVKISTLIFYIGNIEPLPHFSSVFLCAVLMFFYLLYKAGICDCIGRSLCKMVWAFCSSCFYAWEYGCMFLWIKLKNLKRMRRDHVRDILEEYDVSDNELTDESLSYRHAPRAIELRRSFSCRSRERRRIHIRRSLRPRSHRIKVGISRDPVYSNRDMGKHVKTVHDIKVTQTSKFVQKGRANRVCRRRRWWGYEMYSPRMSRVLKLGHRW